MGVKKQFSAKHGREVWGYDIRFGTGRNRTRRRKFGFSSKDAAQLALSGLRLRENERRAGIIPERPAATLLTVQELIERRKRQLSRQAARSALDRWFATLPSGLTLADLKTAHLSQYI